MEAPSGTNGSWGYFTMVFREKPLKKAKKDRIVQIFGKLLQEKGKNRIYTKTIKKRKQRTIIREQIRRVFYHGNHAGNRNQITEGH